MADNIITGRAKKHDGTAIDYVSIFNWSDGKCIAQVTPDASGVWSYGYDRALSVGVTYIANGCEPITHGPYDFNYVSGIPSDTILHYDFNGDLLDRSVNLNHGSKKGVANFVVGRKPNTQALHINAGRILTTTAPTINSMELTVSFWMYREVGYSVGEIIGHIKSDPLPVYFTVALGNYGGTISNLGANTFGNGVVVETSVEVTDGAWHHILITQDKNQAGASENKIYIDNVEAPLSVKASYDGSVQIGSKPIFIGGPSDKYNTLRATIQDVRIYRRLLTSDERTALFNE